MIESIHYVAGEVCQINSSTLHPAAQSFRACLESLMALDDISQAIAPSFVLSPDAEAYATSFRVFLWQGLLPALIGIWGLFSIPKIIKGILGSI